MVSLNLYQTKITASDYNPSIDDSITVTVTLLDFNGNAVTGTNATIEVNQGYFTKYTRNSSDTSISGTSTKSYTGNTGSNGSFTMTYKCSEWGLATFSANTAEIQCKVDGWRDVTSQLTSNTAYTVQLLVNESLRLAKLKYIRSNWGVTKNNTSISSINIPQTYLPRGYHTQTYAKDVYLKLHFNTTNNLGVIECINDTSSSVTVNCYCDFVYTY